MTRVPSLAELAREVVDPLERMETKDRWGVRVREVGTVLSVGKGVARVSGMAGVGIEDMVMFEGGVHGLVLNLDRDSVGVVLLGDEEHLEAGSEVWPLGHPVDVPVGAEVLGRVFDPLGTALDGGRSIRGTRTRPAERAAPSIMARSPVREPLQTGLRVVDALVPVGRGQRELIVGDRQTGKTSIAIDTIINQRDYDVVCVYCAIGQRAASVAGVVERLREEGALEYTAVVVASGQDAPGLQYMAPYAATSVAEFFRDRGDDALIVYDDLTKHARAYRELSLLLRRPPGREGYPGDIFHLHSRLLERATRLREERGGGSLTALPIVETQESNISAYIPTNLISITDGQVFLSPALFRKGIIPAVDVGRSVSRVGGDAQLPAYRSVVRDLRLSYSQFQELEVFSRFASQLDEETRKSLERGRRIREALKQDEHQPLSPCAQLAVLLSVTRGVLDPVSLADMDSAVRKLQKEVPDRLPDLCRKIHDAESLDDEALDTLVREAADLLDVPVPEQEDE
ncbi:MAG: F0F1 ATP synthase subunit alpha [Gemmatimonadota bacterium]